MVFTSSPSFLPPQYDVLLFWLVFYALGRQREVVCFEIKSSKYVMLKPIDITLGTSII